MRDGISRSAQAQRTTATLRRATHTALRAALAHGMAWHGMAWPMVARRRSPQEPPAQRGAEGADRAWAVSATSAWLAGSRFSDGGWPEMRRTPFRYGRTASWAEPVTAQSGLCSLACLAAVCHRSPAHAPAPAPAPAAPPHHRSAPHRTTAPLRLQAAPKQRAPTPLPSYPATQLPSYPALPAFPAG